ncbi:UNVERIFIED_CONTAM: hypothetical protein Sangu_0540400 [Sesamum angustifolium]|uniref:DUF4283 domain-containing protein n=1 Tax=Sesamum angustifolium TaxID=2727405 RepID=A0AAW2Q9K7_9LAMI
MEELNSLKERWQEKFQSPIESESAKLKPVVGRVVTPLRNINIGLAVSTESSPESENVADGKGTAQPERDFVAPTQLNSDQGSQRWQSTAVGYFLGKKPYFPHLESYARSNWRDLTQISATSSGFYFFQFKNRAAMEDIIEEGPWIFQGQPIVLQCWEQGMSLRRKKHTQIPVWIWLKHLPLELWTAEGLSTVASSVGIPLYTDKITKSCSRLDFARVCVMLDYNSTLPKHLVVMHPVRQEGQETPLKIDVEYEWLPQRCKTCCTLGYTTQACLENKKIEHVQSVKVFVKKQPITATTAKSGLADDMLKGGAVPEKSATPLAEPPEPILADKNKFHTKGKDIVAAWNVRGLNGTDHQRAVEHLVHEHHIQFLGLIETRVSYANVYRVRKNFLRNWSWFDDYSGPSGRIWLAWTGWDIEIDILRVESQIIHCRTINKRTHTTCLISVLYGDCDLIPRRTLWNTLQSVAAHADEPWLVLGDFNAVIDDSEVCGHAANTSASLNEFRQCILEFGLIHLPFTGCPFTWHNCSTGSRSLCKLKALKTTFRQQRRELGNLAYNVKRAKRFLDKAQKLFTTYKEDYLLHLVKCCRLVYCQAVKMEENMLHQRAKLQWLKQGDQNTKAFFRKINATRIRQRIFQISTPSVVVLTDMNEITKEFVSYFKTLLGGTRTRRDFNLAFLSSEIKHCLTEDEADLLCAPITVTEIKDAIFDIAEDSAPGPDGYTSAFFKAA